MNDVTPGEAKPNPDAAPPPKKKEEGSFAWFLVKLVIAVFVFRTFIFTSFMIPSESMMPRLLVGDYLFVAKWPYGFSRASLPFDLDFGQGRLFARLPRRGDVIIFKHPIDRVDYVKRVIGLPGDRVEVVQGQVVLNGVPIPKVRIADFVLPVQGEQHCLDFQPAVQQGDGTLACHYARFRETLPGGYSYDVLDFGPSGSNNPWGVDADNRPPVTVPPGHLFAMGDNRDDSEDSRFPAVAGQGVGMVPTDNLVGRASFMFFSTDGSAHWLLPWTWFTAARWSRIGHAI